MSWSLLDEVSLDREIQPKTPISACSARPRVLLTGASGFVGAHLLKALLNAGVEAVVCLVRASTAEEARARVLSNLDRYDVPRPMRADTIVAIRGDLALPRLGLRAAEFDEIASTIDVIVHNGAWVHFSHSYQALRPSNVAGTKELLRLAVVGRTKRFCHVSGMCVFLGTDRMEENGPPLHPSETHGGYFDTKWVAERLVWNAFDRQLPGYIVRPGWISGDSRLGLIGKSDAMTILLRASLRLGVVPGLDGGRVYCTPVDVAARIVAHAALDGTETSRACNLLATHTLSQEDFWARLREAGAPISVIPRDDWLAAIAKRFPILLPMAQTVFGDWDMPVVCDAIGQDLARRVGTGVTVDELMQTYARAWLGDRRSACA